MRFAKWRGLETDYIIIEKESCKAHDCSYIAKSICDRRFGVGAKRLVLLNKQKAFYEITVYRDNGAQCLPCGEALRCAALYIYQNSGNMDISIVSKDIVYNVETPGGICAKVDTGVAGSVKTYKMMLDSGEVEVYELFFEGKNLVVFIPELKKVQKIANEIAGILNLKNCRFILCEAISKRLLRLKLHSVEGGDGLAADAAAVAAFCAGMRSGLVDNNATILLDSGELQLQEHSSHIYVTGPALEVFSGKYKFLSFS